MSDFDEDLSDLWSDPAPDPVVIPQMPALPAAVAGTGVVKRKVRVGPLEDVHDIRHEAARLYRAIRTFDENSDPLLFHIAKFAIPALKLVLEATKVAEIEMEIVNIRRMLEGKNPMTPRQRGKRANGLGDLQ